ncbi:MAG: 18 kDa heat shock protein [Planctomycetes bacterium ADurb.Bin126]|nr:MAG: 18 kDa heat shock protein [Planctomycetes bacterium ADurb.Bin126]HOD80646.1 Hsp20/alpha crystallin family protein [Phycisphaerae bacterium]HQL73908.1 Hsp20/alpha crystallin family protein [Phycisphaerae bacterium]
MATFRWPGNLDTFAPLRVMARELDRLMGRQQEYQQVGGGVYPPVNVFSGSDDMVVQCELAGVKREDIDLSITGETLVIKGAKHTAAKEEDVRYERRERGVGEFSRTVVLPDRVEPSQVQATLKDGILTIRLPKSEAARPRQIPVK